MWYIHTFYTGVCVFSQSSKGEVYLWGTVQILDLLLKSQSMADNVFANPRDFFWSSCMPSHSNYFKTTIQTATGWISASGFITAVLGARTWSFWLGSIAKLIWTVCLSLAQRGISSFSVKQTRTHLCNTLWWPDCCGTQLCRAGRLSGGSCVLAA